MAQRTWSSVRARRLRATKLDNCGAPDPGACGTLVTKGFISVKYSPEISEGTDYEQKNGSDEICVADKAPDALKFFTVEVVLCGVDPELFTFLTGMPLVVDHAGNAVGNRVNDLPFTGDVGLETWTDIPNQICGVGGDKAYGYWLAPWFRNGSLGELTLENGTLNATITGRTQAGSGWGEGPYDVDAQDVGNTPGPLLTPIGDNDHLDMHLTTIAPPVVTAGCVALA